VQGRRAIDAQQLGSIPCLGYLHRKRCRSGGELSDDLLGASSVLAFGGSSRVIIPMKAWPYGNFISSLAIAIFAGLPFGVRVCNAAEPVMEPEVGATVLHGSRAATLGASVRWPKAGPGTTDWECGLFVIDEYHYRGSAQPRQAVANCLLVAHIIKKRFDFGAGAAYLYNTDAINGSRLNFALLAQYRVTDRLTISWRHWSNAGIVLPNVGRDVVLVGWNF
jgi:hypothetical protein